MDNSLRFSIVGNEDEHNKNNKNVYDKDDEVDESDDDKTRNSQLDLIT